MKKGIKAPSVLGVLCFCFIIGATVATLHSGEVYCRNAFPTLDCPNGYCGNADIGEECVLNCILADGSHILSSCTKGPGKDPANP